eukprot:gene11223-13083_t
MVVALEHRFFGYSNPFNDTSTEHLRLLTTEQTLEDVAMFIHHFKRSVPNAGGVITFGCSYAGGLSAWFRVKYPHLTVGAISSSGLVNVIRDFYQFDQWVSHAFGEECSGALKMVTSQVMEAMDRGELDQIRKLYHAEELTDPGDFFYWLADTSVFGAQYGWIQQICDIVVPAMNNGSDMVKSYAKVTEMWIDKHGSPNEYSTLLHQNETLEVKPGLTARLWWYQGCSEIGYFQTAPAVGSIRSSYVNMTYFLDHCKKVFGKSLWPNTEATNIIYGGVDNAATNIK